MRLVRRIRPALALTGAVLLGLLWLGPLPGLARGSFVAHMTLHMGVVALAAPLLAVGLAGGPIDPVRRAPRLFGPLLAALVELVVVWGWHAPVLHEAARRSATLFALEQGSFLAAGLLVWLSAFGGDREDRDDRSAAGAGALLLTSMHMTLLGTLLALAPRPLYEHAAVGGPGVGTAAALVGQQLGGTLMLVVGGVVYLAGGLVLVTRLLRARGATPAPAAAGGGRS